MLLYQTPGTAAAAKVFYTTWEAFSEDIVMGFAVESYPSVE